MKKKRPLTKVSTSRLRELAVEANADPRTVANVLAGGPREGLARKRIIAVLTKAGLLMAALISSIAISGCRDSSGNPLSGGRVYLTRPGTQVDVTAYSNDDATAAHTLNQGGVVLDAGGRAAIYTNEPADIRVEDSDGVTAATYADPMSDAKLVQVRNTGFTGTDPVSGAQVTGGVTALDRILSNLAASVGGSDGYFRVAATGTLRTIQSKFSEIQTSVKDFGAVGNGVADDTPFIQEAINYIISLGGGTVYFPPGTYLTTSALTFPVSPVPVLIRGADKNVSIIKNSNTTGNCFTVTLNTQYSFRSIRISHSSSSTGAGVAGSGVGYASYFEDVTITGHAIGVSVGTGGAFVTQSGFATSAASTSGALVAAGTVVMVGGSATSTSGIGVQVSSGTTKLLGVVAGGGIVSVDVLGAASLYAVAVTSSTSVLGLRTAASSATVSHAGCDWGAGGVTDGRTGAPVNYVFAGANNVTPLPLQADVIRVAQSTGAVVTTINNITAIGFRTFTLICSNTSAGASTFTFGANYVLSAAVAPAAGTRVNLLLAYDPVSGKCFEVGRAATAN